MYWHCLLFKLPTCESSKPVSLGFGSPTPCGDAFELMGGWVEAEVSIYLWVLVLSKPRCLGS